MKEHQTWRPTVGVQLGHQVGQALLTCGNIGEQLRVRQKITVPI
jgi:hypothetical protein